MNKLVIISFVLCTLCGVCDGVVELTQRAQSGQQTILPCRLDGGSDDNTIIRWKADEHGYLTSGTIVEQFRDNLEVVKSSSNEWNLMIKRVSQTYADVYRCMKGGEELFRVTLKINVAPRVDEVNSSPSSVTAKEGDDTELTCQFTGEPTPDITWLRGDTGNPTTIGIQGEMLRIPSTPRASMDTYICRGNNSVGHKDHKISLSVEFGPEVLMKDKLVSVKDTKSNVTFGCIIMGQPILNAFWMTPYSSTPVTLSNWKYGLVTKKDLGTSFPMWYLGLTLRANSYGTRSAGNFTCHGHGDGTEAVNYTEFRLIDEDAVP